MEEKDCIMEKETKFKQDFTSDYAKKRYKELQNKPIEKLNHFQRSFMVDMYHYEEYQAGLL